MTHNLTVHPPLPNVNHFGLQSHAASASKKRSFQEIENRSSLLEACRTNQLSTSQRLKIAVIILDQMKITLGKLGGNGFSLNELGTFLPENVQIIFEKDYHKIEFVHSREYTLPEECSCYRNDPRSQIKDVYIASHILYKILPQESFEKLHELNKPFFGSDCKIGKEKPLISSLRKDLFDQLITNLGEQARSHEENDRLVNENEEKIIYTSSEPLAARMRTNCYYSFNEFRKFLPSRSKLLIINNILQKIFYSRDGLSQEEMLQYYPRNMSVFYSLEKTVTISSLTNVTAFPKSYRPMNSYSEVFKRSKPDNLFIVANLLREFFPYQAYASYTFQKEIQKEVYNLIYDLSSIDPSRLPEIFEKIQHIFLNTLNQVGV
ncbi:MAG TPA: hypothetical protein VLG49_00470 [Rhabdochlamydiaceae bacterium]|nr:hypothetical protein [Rhabdochlamydiaceae bacterium]